MKFSSLPLQKAKLLRRYKRFLCDVQLKDGSTVTLHCPNPGSMKTLIDNSLQDVYYIPKTSGKLSGTLELIKVKKTWVGINTLRANTLAQELLLSSHSPLGKLSLLEKEKSPLKGTRLDFYAEKRQKKLWIEVKSVTMAYPPLALFPDAPTERGRKHIDVLSSLTDKSTQAIMLFLVQRSDCQIFKLAQEIDPVYVQKLKTAVLSKKIKCFAFSFDVGPQGYSPRGQIPLIWE